MTVKGSSGLPRGIRNNNPANIEDTGTSWRGKVGSDGRFVVFDTPLNGIRAIARILNTYRTKHGIVSIEQIISRWAPPSENNTESYIAHAVRELGVPRNMPLSTSHYPALIKVIIKHENGLQPYSDEVINAGIAAA